MDMSTLLNAIDNGFVKVGVFSSLSLIKMAGEKPSVALRFVPLSFGRGKERFFCL